MWIRCKTCSAAGLNAFTLTILLSRRANQQEFGGYVSGCYVGKNI